MPKQIDNDNMLDNEFDEVEEDLNIDVNKFSQAVIWGTDWTTETINNQMLKGNIDLSPSFQRRDAWNKQEKSRLIESLMLGLPVPPIILAENKEKRNSYIVIDGKQRLLSIRQFYADKLKDDNERNNFEVLKLSGLELLKTYNQFTYTNFEADGEFNQLLSALDNQPIRTIVIKNWPDESFLYTVFLRLNTGSKKLSSQELRQALKAGPFLQFLDEKTAESKVIQHMLHNNGPDKRMKDVELALRYFAFRYFITLYEGNLKKFLDITCDYLNHEWEKRKEAIQNEFSLLEQAIQFSFEVIDSDNPFSRDETHSRFNRSLFELFTYYFTDSSIQKLVKSNKKEFLEGLQQLNLDPRFKEATSYSTKNINNVVSRFSLFAELLKKLPNNSETRISIPLFILDNTRHIQITKQLI